MKYTDHLLQRWRIAKVRPHIPAGSRILDIGSGDGALFTALGSTLGRDSLGVEPTLQKQTIVNGCRLLPGFFPQAVPADAGLFDVMTMLAVLEHFPPDSHPTLRTGCEQFLRPGGKLLITVPSPLVDNVLAALKFLRLVDGMSLEEHHGFEVGQTRSIFPPASFCLVSHAKFQLGLNHLWVFERCPPAP